ncbi:MAG: undecaprenyl-diphosphate phosphatase [Methanothrix sp.]|jgi:undecaprenyl-diphosphatase|uniref:undecaprenyl-diphosphate phosphatase n=1 Tax=Methanothrix sp. TaxID=90426 RepID=UPI0025DB95DB|nr:undecaprenyl-diphosphate phosphatase [Methanothrix sp.]MBK7386525.1 undecaprenyl-diphosphate phosphatase [Methanothrix sp.]
MDALQGIVLGVSQGILEWIPVSSQGQSMLAMIYWLGLSPNDALTNSIFLHLGTMFAVLIRFRREFIKMIKDIDSMMTRIIIVSTLCTGITGIPLYLLFQESFTGGREATILIGCLLIATGFMLRFKGSGARGTEDMGLMDMVVLGLAQGFSILPGVSRSGTTLTVLLMRGFKQDEALAVSFIISVPAVLGAILLDHSISEIPWATATVMLIASLAVGYLTMDLLIRFAQRINFSGFCIAFGLITLLFSIVL